MLAGGKCRLPDRSFIDLAVAHDDINATVALLHARSEPHSDADRQAMAQGTGRCLNPGYLVRFRVSTEDRIAVAEGVKRLDGNETLVCKQDVLRDTAMALAEDHPIAATPLRLVRRDNAEHRHRERA